MIKIKPLVWTDELKPGETCHYNHCAAQTPFGRILITWKSWKDDPSPTVDEAPWYDAPEMKWLVGYDVAGTQALVEAEYQRRIRAALTDATPGGRNQAAAATSEPQGE